MIIQVLGYLVAGIGLCCFSSVMITTKVDDLREFSFQRLIYRSSTNYFVNILNGMIVGFFTQARTLQSYIFNNHYASQKNQLQSTLTLINWNALGMCLFAFVFLNSFRTITPYILGITGLMSLILYKTKAQPILSILFSFFLLFFGLTLVQTSAESLVGREFVHSLLVSLKESYLVAILLGALFVGLTQTFIAFVIIIIVLAQAGILDVFLGGMMIFGAHIGLGLAIWSDSSKVDNITKRSLFQLSFYHLIAGLAGITLLTFEKLFKVPLIVSWVQTISLSIGVELAIILFVINLIMATVLTLFQKKEVDLLVKYFPSESGVEISNPHYLNPGNIKNSESAIALMDLEIKFFTPRLGKYFEIMKGYLSGKKIHNPAHLHKNLQNLFKQLQVYVTELSKQVTDSKSSDTLMIESQSLNFLSSLENNLFNKTKIIKKIRETNPTNEQLLALCDLLIESEEAIFEEFRDAILVQSHEDLNMVVKLTSSKEEAIYAIIEKYLNIQLSADQETKNDFYHIATLYEQDLWLMNVTCSLFLKKADSPLL